MYDKNDKRQAILRVQLYLQTVSRVNNNVSRVNPDGIYGPKTEESVKEFQRSYSLPVTGVVDYDTFTLLFSEYERVNKEAEMNHNYKKLVSNGTIKKGQKSDAVKTVQVMLNVLATAYDGYNKVEINGEFDELTDAAIKHFQSVNDIIPDGIVGPETLSKLMHQTTIHSYSQ